MSTVPVARARRFVRLLPRRAKGRALYHGDEVECPCCCSRYRRFAPLHGPNRLCWQCGSLERDRLLWLFLDRNPDLLEPGMAMLHVAPEAALRPRLEHSVDRYECGDLTGVFGDQRIDITDLPFGDGAFDAVVCNHVLEHVPDDRSAMRELRRVLRPRGWALLLVPDVAEPGTVEDPSIIDPAERLRRFGQHDHVRRYGLDYLERLAASGFEPQMIDLRPELAEHLLARHGLEKFGQLEPIFLCRAGVSG